MDTLLADGKGVLADVCGKAQLSYDVIAQFPSLSDLEPNAELLHPQMGTLAAAICEAALAGDTSLPLQICNFISEVIRKPNAISDIEHAVAISFSETYALPSMATGKTVLKLMPANVRRVLLEQEKWGSVQ